MPANDAPAAARRQVLRAALLHLFATAAAPLVRRRRPSAIRRVLFIRPDHIGDALFATPALELWRRGAPAGMETTVSAGPWSADVLRHGPLPESVETFPYPGFTRARPRSLLSPYVALLAEARRLRRRQFDMAVILRFDHWWGGLLAFAAGIPVRIGYATDPLARFLNVALPYEGRRHEVERNLALAELALGECGAEAPAGKPFPALRYDVTPAEREGATALLAAAGVPAGERIVALHVGAGAPVKQWPAERFAHLGDALAGRGVAVVLTGGPAELSLAWQVAAGMMAEPAVLAGRTTLPQLAAVLSHCDAAVGADSGPLHLAAAVGTPTLHLFGPADPALFGPWSDAPAHHRVLMADCPLAPCNRLDYTADELPAHRCMETIQVAEVLQATLELLD